MKKEKLYTEDDLRKAFKAGEKYGEDKGSWILISNVIDEDEYIESLNPKQK